MARSFVPPSSRPILPRSLALHSQDTIRDSTMEISSMPLRTPQSIHSQEAFIFPDISATPSQHDPAVPHTAASSIMSFRPAEDVSDLEASTSTLSTRDSGTMTPRARLAIPSRSALSLLLARHEEESRSATASPTTESGNPTPTVERPDATHRSLSAIREVTSTVTSLTQGASGGGEEADLHSSCETIPLLADLEANHRTYHTRGDDHSEAVGKRSARVTLKDITVRIAKGTGPLAKDALKSIPAVILGTLLNILDGISCKSISLTGPTKLCFLSSPADCALTDGMIIFPASGIFADLGGVGVSMFFVS